MKPTTWLLEDDKNKTTKPDPTLNEIVTEMEAYPNDYYKAYNALALLLRHTPSYSVHAMLTLFTARINAYLKYQDDITQEQALDMLFNILEACDKEFTK